MTCESDDVDEGRWDPKDPEAEVSYSIDWSRVLKTLDTIVDNDCEIVNSEECGVEIEGEDSIDGTQHIVKLKGGDEGTIAKVRFYIETASGDKEYKTMSLAIEMQ